MTGKELIGALREDAEWAAANEWETPITLGDNLTEAADRLEALLAENERLTIELQAYKDTGLTPEEVAEYKKFEDEAVSKGVPFSRIVELMNADKEGRLVVLPCKVGDTVYRHKFPVITDPDGTQHYLCDSRKMTVEPAKFSLLMLQLETEFWLTREEAEQALKEAKQ